MSLHSTAEDYKVDQTPEYCESLKRWPKGCYSLASDGKCSKVPILDLFLHFGVGESYNPVEAGGEITYIAKDEEEALIVVEPLKNKLALVFRDDDTMFFNKYLNEKFGGGEFYEVHFQYKE